MFIYVYLCAYICVYVWACVQTSEKDLKGTSKNQFIKNKRRFKHEINEKRETK